MAWGESGVSTPILTAVEKKQLAEKEIEDWILSGSENPQQVVALVYGADGTAKSGIALSYPLKEGEKMIILDLDGGDIPIAKTFHKERYEKGDIIIKDPTTVNVESGEIDYEETFRKIKLTSEWVKNNHKKHNIKLFIVDGISTLLKYSEFKMREFFNKTVVDGMDMRFWKIRSKIFLEILTIAKSIPINVIFIAHEDFIAKKEEEFSSGVKQRCNQMAFQKIRCEKTEDKDKIVYHVIIDKQKYNAVQEGQKINVIINDKVKKQIEWKGQDLWNLILK